MRTAVPSIVDRGGCAGTALAPSRDGCAPTIGAVTDARESMRFRDLTLGEFVERLASPEPVPGGGSAGGRGCQPRRPPSCRWSRRSRSGATSTRSTRRTSSTPRRPVVSLSNGCWSSPSRTRSRTAATLSARQRPKDTDEQRARRAVEIGEAARRAAEVPLETLRACLEVAAAAERSPVGAT